MLHALEHNEGKIISNPKLLAFMMTADEAKAAVEINFTLSKSTTNHSNSSTDDVGHITSFDFLSSSFFFLYFAVGGSTYKTYLTFSATAYCT